jgi:hypothetical protein
MVPLLPQEKAKAVGAKVDDLFFGGFSFFMVIFHNVKNDEK